MNKNVNECSSDLDQHDHGYILPGDLMVDDGIITNLAHLVFLVEMICLTDRTKTIVIATGQVPVYLRLSQLRWGYFC